MDGLFTLETHALPLWEKCRIIYLAFLYSLFLESLSLGCWLSRAQNQVFWFVYFIFLSHFHIFSLSFSESWEIVSNLSLNALIEGLDNSCYWYHHFYFQEFFMFLIFSYLFWFMGIISYLDKTNVLWSLFVLDPTSDANDFPKMLSNPWSLALKCETLLGWLQALVCIWGSSIVGFTGGSTALSISLWNHSVLFRFLFLGACHLLVSLEVDIKTKSGGKMFIQDGCCEGKRTGQKEEVKLGHRSPWPGAVEGMLPICVPYWAEMATSVTPISSSHWMWAVQKGYDLGPGDSLQLSQTPEGVDVTPSCPSCAVRHSSKGEFLKGGMMD